MAVATDHRHVEAMRPESPCIQICTIADDGCCEGCFRSLAEIAGWSAMSAREQRQVIDALHYRRDERRGPAGRDG